MKKILFLSLFFAAIISTSVHAQNGPQKEAGYDPAVMLQQMKEKQVPGLVSKAGLTEAQANKIVEINLELRISMMTDIKDLSEADRSKRMAEFAAAKEKKYSEIPLTPEQIKAVYAYYEDMRKNMPQKN